MSDDTRAQIVQAVTALAPLVEAYEKASAELSAAYGPDGEGTPDHGFYYARDDAGVEVADAVVRLLPLLRAEHNIGDVRT